MTTDASCAFCSIVAGDEPAFEVLRDELCVAFLDRRPVFEGHVLIVPVEHVETMRDLPAELLGELYRRVQSMTAVMEDHFGADGTFVATNNRVSQSVAHLHVHVIPRHRKDGLRGFFWPRVRYADDDSARAVADKIAHGYRTLVD